VLELRKELMPERKKKFGGAHDLNLKRVSDGIAPHERGQMVFSQVMERVPHWEFQRLARAHADGTGGGSFRTGITSWRWRFAQMTFRESLRDIEACLNTQPG